MPNDSVQDPVIDVHDLAKSYGRRRAVNAVSFEVRRGEIFGILGPNGAGKTTAVECVAGLRRRDSGTVRVLGVDPEVDRAAVRRHVGIQLQNGELPEKLQVGEALRLFAGFYPEPVEPTELIEVLGLGDVLNSAWGRLSGGQKQRLSIALALIGPDHRDPGRADHRPGSGRPPGDLEPDRGGSRPGRDDPAGHPLHAGGRAAL